MSILKKAHERLFPEKEFIYETEVIYSKKLAPYNATIRKTGQTLTLHAHENWKEVDEEIAIGLAEWLLLKLFKKKASTYNLELYTNFIKEAPQLAPLILTLDFNLKSSFERVNFKFFNSEENQPNLRWGKPATRKLASYDYHTNTITISSLFKEAPLYLLDFLMYHELLHKHLLFECKNVKNYYHTPVFKQKEALYPNFKQVELELNHYAKTHKVHKHRLFSPLRRLFS